MDEETRKYGEAGKEAVREKERKTEMMRVRPVVKRKRKAREGKGFSREELREVGLSLSEALKQGIPIDTRRSTKHEENVTKLEAYRRALKPKPPAKKKAKIVELSEVKGVGPKTAKKLIEAGIENANQLAVSSPETVSETLGSSEKKATNLIEEARSLLKET